MVVAVVILVRLVTVVVVCDPEVIFITFAIPGSWVIVVIGMVMVLPVVTVVFVGVVIFVVVVVVVCPSALSGFDIVNIKVEAEGEAEVEAEVEVDVETIVEVVVGVIDDIVDSLGVLVSGDDLEADSDMCSDVVVREGADLIFVIIIEDVVNMSVLVVVTTGSQISLAPSLTRHRLDSHFSSNLGGEPFPSAQLYTDPESNPQIFGKVDPQALESSRQVQTTTSEGSFIHRSGSTGKFLRHPNSQLSVLVGNMPLLLQT